MLNHDEARERTMVQPVSRDAFLAEWRDDPKAIFERADEAELDLHAFGSVRAPATIESPGSTWEWLLFNEGVRMADTFAVPSTRMVNLPAIDPPAGQDPEPMARAMNAYWDECYTRTVFTGQRAAQSLSTQTVGGPWRPRYDEAPIRAPQIAPGFDFMELVAFSRTISEDRYRIPQWRNRQAEQIMQEVAEGTEPKLFEITRDETEVAMRNYRAGIEATDSFLNDNQTRAMDITNAIEEIAIGHRIALLNAVCKLLNDSVPSGNVYTSGNVHGITHESGQMDYPNWNVFLKRFGNAYIPNTTIGNSTAITSLELMSMSAGDQNISFGNWSMVPNSNIRNLNGDFTQMNYGWVDDSSIGFTNTKLITFQRETTIVYVQRRGMDQDEMERVPGPRKTRRWLGTQSTFGLRDANGLRQINF